MLDINTVIIPEGRQRQANREIDKQFITSVCKRLINPIVLRMTPDGPTLVAGERRLSALRAGGLTELTPNIHFRFFEDLTPDEAEIIELEENVKREDLAWQDHIRAVARITDLFRKRIPGILDETIAAELNISGGMLSMHLIVSRNLDSTNLRDATGIRQAYSILQQISERRTVSIVEDIAKAGNRIFNPPERTIDEPNSPNSPPPSDNRQTLPSPVPPSDRSPIDSRMDIGPNSLDPPILNADFIPWANNYTGDKFTLIHCDFPYDVKYDSYAKSISSVTDDYDFSGYWPLMGALCDNIPNLMSYSAHLMLWFSMKFYEQTRQRLEKAGLYVHDHPLIWHKTDNSGIIPGRDGLFPRRTYETAFLATRGRRPLVRSLANIYGAPMASNAIHPSQKPIPVLRHFFGMLVDETTDVLDPTAGSGMALQAAEELGARRIVGLEINPTYTTAANGSIAAARRMRKITQ